MKRPEQHRIFAQKMKAGCTIKESMMSAGYSENVAKKGRRGITGKLLQAMSAEGYKLADFGKSLTLEMLKNIAIGRLAQNAIAGTDKGVMSAKQLGAHRDINLWVAESQAGVIVIGMPNRVTEHESKLLEGMPIQEETKE